VNGTGRTAAIGALDDTEAILVGTAGTIITPSGRYMERDHHGGAVASGVRMRMRRRSQGLRFATTRRVGALRDSRLETSSGA